jgi:hypothetical protein
VYPGALASVELAGDDDQQRCVQLQDGFLQAVQIYAQYIKLSQGFFRRAGSGLTDRRVRTGA